MGTDVDGDTWALRPQHWILKETGTGETLANCCDDRLWWKWIEHIDSVYLFNDSAGSVSSGAEATSMSIQHLVSFKYKGASLKTLYSFPHIPT